MLLALLALHFTGCAPPGLPAEVLPAEYTGRWAVRIGSPRDQAGEVCEGEVELPEGAWFCGPWKGQARMDGSYRIALRDGNFAALLVDVEPVDARGLFGAWLEGIGVPDRWRVLFVLLPPRRK